MTLELIRPLQRASSSNADGHNSLSQSTTATITVVPSPNQSTLTPTPFIHVHLMTSLTPETTQPGSIPFGSIQFGTLPPQSIALGSTPTISIPTISIAAQTAQPVAPDNSQQALAESMENRFKILERRMLQSLRHPANYDDMVDEIQQSPFTKKVTSTPLLAKFHAPNFSKFN